MKKVLFLKLCEFKEIVALKFYKTAKSAIFKTY